MTIKRKINTILRETGLPVGYRMSDTSVLPRFSFSLMYNDAERLSNKRHDKRLIYQIDYFCINSIEIEDFPLFDEVINNLEAINLTVGDWQENSFYNEETEINLYHYILDVSGYG